MDRNNKYIDFGLNIEIRSSDFDPSITFAFGFNDQIWSVNILKTELQNESERMKRLELTIQHAISKLLVPHITTKLLNLLVTSALKGENPLE